MSVFLKLNKKGALLVEALITIMIIAISLTLIIRAVVTGLKGAVYIDDYTQAEFMAENVMSDFIRNGLPSSSKIRLNDKFSCRYRTKPLKDSPGLKELQFQIRWPGGRQYKYIDLESYVSDQ